MTVPNALNDYIATDQKLRTNLELYCSILVQIQDKAGQIRPFVWNEAQRQLHAKLEAQLDSRGLVRAIILKARRLGISTYCGARFYQRSTLNMGRNSFILTHEDKSTKQLFDLVKLIHENMHPDYRPDNSSNNANELRFASPLNGGYRVGTAHNTTGGLGRGFTLQQFHGSEVAFWPRAQGHFAGIMKAVSLMPGTEMILESTANGVGGVFYDQWALAERGQSDFIPIFLPWYIDPDNARALPSDYEPSAEEQEYQELHGLTDEQLCWAHFENIQVGGEPGVLCAMFRQENPATAAEAFQSTGTDSFIPAEAVLRARRLEIVAAAYEGLPRVIGVDVARGGGDLTRIVDRQGRKAGRIDEVLNTADLMQVAHAVMRTLRDNPDIRKAFIDVTGLGAGVYDICRANGFEKRISAVNFGSQAQNPKKFSNRRAEMWGRVKDWILDAGGASIPDNDVAHKHLIAPSYKYDANSRLQLEKKEDIKKRLNASPDWGDALALTFADILAIAEPDERPKWMRDLASGDDDDDDFMTK